MITPMPRLLMRRKDREITRTEALALLAGGEYGVLSTVDQEAQPYGVPLSYAQRGDRLYFHCALSGHKLENLADNPRASFCVVGKTRLLPDQFATEYESVIAFGIVTEVHGAERDEALLWLLEKYSPAYLEEGKQYIAQKNALTRVLRMSIDQLSGKARR
jgi:uncharacterized protein